MDEQLRIILIIIVSVTIFGLLVFIFVKNFIRNKINNSVVFSPLLFSSLNKEFLPQYSRSMDAVDKAIVFYDPQVIEHKRLPAISIEDVKKAFAREDLEVITNIKSLETRLQSIDKNNHCLLMMSSGRFGGANIS